MVHTTPIDTILQHHLGLIARAVRDHTPAKLKPELEDIQQNATIHLLEKMRGRDCQPSSTIIYNIIKCSVIDQVRHLTRKRQISAEPLEYHDIVHHHSDDHAIEALASDVTQRPDKYLPNAQARAVIDPAGAGKDARYKACRAIRSLATLML
jgi:hypothetical protein